jgi:hypothetical protein
LLGCACVAVRALPVKSSKSSSPSA